MFLQLMVLVLVEVLPCGVRRNCGCVVYVTVVLVVVLGSGEGVYWEKKEMPRARAVSALEHMHQKADNINIYVHECTNK